MTQEQVVVVTGGASGIGRASAEAFRADGASVVCLDRSDDESCEFVDMSDPRSIDAAIGALPDRVDVLCNIAGVPGTFDGDTVIAVNFLGLRHLTERVIDRMPPGGAIVNVASTAAAGWESLVDILDPLVCTPDYASGLEAYRRLSTDVSPYTLSKAAVILYSMRRAWDWRSKGVRLNCVLPGPVDTPILDDFRASMGVERLDGIARIVGRHGRPVEIAAAVMMLASPAATWINGCNLVVDGGFLGGHLSGCDMTAVQSS